jgi:putative flippase GtrA
MALVPDMRPGGHISFPSLRWHAVRALRYGIVGTAGLALDLSLFLLMQAAVGPFVANIVSSGAALTFVYCVSVRGIFRYHGKFIVPLFAAYTAYHVCGTLVVSEVISALVHAGVAPALAKVGILPVTFSANYLFMSWLTRNRQRWLQMHR